MQVIHTITQPYFYFMVKHEKRLLAAITICEFIRGHLIPKLTAQDAHEWRLALETRNVALNVEMSLRASLFRTESRGGHMREDYPLHDDPNWLAWILIEDEQGQMKLHKEQIPQKWWPDLSKPYEERYFTEFPTE
jgi:succinate dehydrogenase/fumarate reductase flavoprotein subunit